MRERKRSKGQHIQLTHAHAYGLCVHHAAVRDGRGSGQHATGAVSRVCSAASTRGPSEVGEKIHAASWAWVDGDDARPCAMRMSCSTASAAAAAPRSASTPENTAKRCRTSMRAADAVRSQRNLSAQRRGRAQGAQRCNKEPTCDRVRRLAVHGARKKAARCHRSTSRDGRVEGAQWSTLAAARARRTEAMDATKIGGGQRSEIKKSARVEIRVQDEGGAARAGEIFFCPEP